MTAPARTSRMLLALLALATAAAGAAVGFLSPAQLWSTPRIVGYVIGPMVTGVTMALIAWRRPSWSTMVLVYVASAGLAAVLAEIVLSRSGEGQVAPAAKQAATGTLPHFCPGTLPGSAGALSIGSRPTLPLTGISRNPLGAGVDGRMRTTDEYGFNNPEGLWSAPPVDIVTVGDSFTFGADVPVGAGFVDRIRTRIPSTVNLGCGGNGPVSELAALIEYGAALRPRIVLWVFYEGNDLTKDVLNEAKSPVLSRYLQPTPYRQDLMSRRQEIDTYLRDFLKPRPPSAAAPAGTSPAFDLRAALTLSTLRTRLGLQHGFTPAALAAFDTSLQRAVALVKGWGGRLVFVYLPAESRFTSAIARADARGYAEVVRATVTKYGVPIVDVAAKLETEPHPRKFFAGHFTVEGYAKTADIILQELSAKRLIRN